MESCPNVSRRSRDWKEITGKKNLLEEGHWKEQEVEKVSSGKSRPVEEVSSGRQLRSRLEERLDLEERLERTTIGIAGKPSFPLHRKSNNCSGL